MSGVPNLSRFASKDTPAETIAAAVDPQAQSPARPGPWRHLLRPQIVEKAVLTVDLVLIVAIGFVCSLLYHLAAKADSTKAIPFIGVGLIVAFNFVALMAARRNYDL